MEDANIQEAIRRLLLRIQAVVSLSLSLAALVNGASAHPEAGKPPKMTIGAMEVGEHCW